MMNLLPPQELIYMSAEMQQTFLNGAWWVEAKKDCERGFRTYDFCSTRIAAFDITLERGVTHVQATSDCATGTHATQPNAEHLHGL